MVPTIGVLLILNMGSILNAGFEQILLLQTTPTLKVSEILDTYILRRGINQGQHGYAAAIGMVRSVLTMCLVVIVNNTSRKFSEVSLW
jgi:putative aldouronate transport system permease protein